MNVNQLKALQKVYGIYKSGNKIKLSIKKMWIKYKIFNIMGY